MDNLSNKEQIIEKFNQIQIEILNIGWKGILETYHPDSNFHPEAFKVFQLYKEIFEKMKERLIIGSDYLVNATENSEN